jgi:hypothetical protein
MLVNGAPTVGSQGSVPPVRSDAIGRGAVHKPVWDITRVGYQMTIFDGHPGAVNVAPTLMAPVK